uniref:Reverse transcriptase domain-containing protein n=1 Tax=Cannabis sativa TaxID=3483 RepID=A0A803PU77_CANSA
MGADRNKAVNDEVTKMLENDTIEEVQYPTWLANLVVVPKKIGKWRVCIDFTELNKACPKDSFPLPHIDMIIDATAGHELMSFMDAFSGYNQIMMHPPDRDKTSFITERGTYCYEVMPFGLKNAGATYQRMVNKMFAQQLGLTMEAYIDDMLVKSKDGADHVDHLRECFQILLAHSMKLNPAKCAFAVGCGKFLGHLVTRRGVKVNPDQIEAFQATGRPRTIRDIQKLTGKIAALSRFISKLSNKSLPFYDLLRGNRKFSWDEKCQLALETLKRYLTTPPVLSKLARGNPTPLPFIV